jgi:hypothetical protein
MMPRAAVVGRRACAVLAACTAVLHGITIGHTETAAAALLMAAMAVVCLYCARELWMQSALRTWVLVAVMNIAMIAAHTPFASGHQHGGGGAVASIRMHSSTVMMMATALAAVEAVIATAVVYQRSRQNLKVVAPTAYGASR